MSNRISSVRRPFRAIISAAAALTLVAACGSDSDGGAEENSGDNVTVSTNTGEKEVPLNPERVAVLDNTAMETVLEFDITPVAVPKPLIPEGIFGEWIGDDEIFDVGSHREPDFEALNESEPDVIIGGYRFEEYSDELEKIAPVVDVAPAGEAQSDYVSGLKNQTEALGAIFDEDEAAEEIIGKFDTAVADADEATDGETVFLAVTTGNTIDNGAGRIGRIIEPLNLQDAFADEDEDLDEESVHNDSGMAPETVAQANPDWAIVMDRDAAIETAEDFTPAKNLFDAQEAWNDVTFMTEDQVIYLDPFFYTREGIQAYTEAYQDIADAFGGQPTAE